MIPILGLDRQRDGKVLLAVINNKRHARACARTFRENKSMSDTTVRTASFQTLPVELIYRILDYLDNVTILLSCRNVCTRLNNITNGYHRYRVKVQIFSLG